MVTYTSSITLTLGEQSENHVGMVKQGNGIAESGYKYDELLSFKKKFSQIGCKVTLYCLNDILQDSDSDDIEQAYILIIRKGVDKILEGTNITADSIFIEQNNLAWDKKYYDTRRKKVLNKSARYNLCYGDEHIDPDYINKQGTVIAYDEIPKTTKFKKRMEKLLKIEQLEMEGNNYYDINKCGIGYHGDSERKKVIGCRFGASSKLVYRWFYKAKQISNNIEFMLNSGDIYIMSEKASGYDWKKRNIHTLRHAAGCDKYIK
jgi:hypothetical protein